MSRPVPFILLLLIPLFWSCQTWDLSDPVIRESIVEPINSGTFMIRIDDKNHPYLLDMLDNPDPQMRMAALHLVEYNIGTEYFIPLLEMTLDEFPEISEEANRIILKIEKSFFPWVTENLANLDYEILGPALKLLALEHYYKASEPIKELFWQDSKAISRLAAQALALLIIPEDPMLEELKLSQDPIARKAYYQILYHFKDPQLIPLILKGLDDIDSQVWGLTVSLLYNYGKEIIPYLQDQLLLGEYRLVLAVMQILEKIRIPEGIPLLIELADSEYQAISQRSALQLQIYGESSIPYIKDSLPRASEQQIKVFLWVLQHLYSDQYLDLYATILDRNIPWATDSVLSSLETLGQGAWTILRPRVLSAPSPLNRQILRFLRDQGDSYLVIDDSGTLLTDNAYILLINSSTAQLNRYIEETSLPRRFSRELLLLHSASDKAERWSRLLTESGDEEQSSPYQELYFLWEETLVQSRGKRANARDYSQQYFETHDRELLSLSRKLREESDNLILKASEMEQQLKLIAVSDSQGKERIDQWLALRLELSVIWRDISPSFRNLAERVYRHWGIDGNQLMNINRLN